MAGTSDKNYGITYRTWEYRILNYAYYLMLSNYIVLAKMLKWKQAIASKMNRYQDKCVFGDEYGQHLMIINL